MIYRLLYKIVENYQNQISGIEPFDPVFVEQSLDFLDKVIENSRHLSWDNLEELEQYKVKHLLFRWLEEMKQVAILIRDIQLKTTKEIFALEDGLVTQSIMNDELYSSFDLLNEALGHLSNDLNKIDMIDQINSSLDEVWYHHISPLDEYLEQFEMISSQIESLDSSRGELLHIAQDIKINKLAIHDQLEYFLSSIKNVLTKVQDILRLIEVTNNVADSKQLKTLLTTLNDFHEELQEHKVKVINNQAEIETLGKISVPVYVDGAELVVKELNISNQITQWLEEEIYPTVLDITRLDELIHEKGIVATLNTKSRVELLTMDIKEDQIVPKGMLSSPMRQFYNDAKNIYNEIEHHTEKLERRMSSDYRLSYIFSKENLFLNDNVEFSLSDYRRSKHKRKLLNLTGFKNRYEDFTKKYLPDLSFRKSSNMDIIEFVDMNKLPELDQFSQSLFLKEGYIGNSFIMPRTEFEEMVRTNYNNWRAGYRGSILIYGNRLSGRSAALESIPHILQDTRIIQLKPDTELRFKGRKHKTGYDLAGTLEFIYKNSITDEVIVTVDDFELWRSSGISALGTAKIIAEKFNRYSRKMLLIFSMNHHIMDKLDSYIDFSDLFLGQYCTDKMDNDDIAKSLLIRHSASLREMSTDIDVEKLDEIELSSLAKKVAKKSHNNVGASLKNWSKFIFHRTNDQGEIKPPPQSFINLILENAHILNHFLRYKITSEGEMREMIGDNYLREFSDDIQILLSYQILVRDRNNHIFINKALVRFVEEIILKEHITPNSVRYV